MIPAVGNLVVVHAPLARVEVKLPDGLNVLSRIQPTAVHEFEEGQEMPTGTSTTVELPTRGSWVVFQTPLASVETNPPEPPSPAKVQLVEEEQEMVFVEARAMNAKSPLPGPMVGKELPTAVIVQTPDASVAT